MKINHNKKRNVGIIYEMLLKYISKSLVEENANNAIMAKAILKKHYRKGTELYREHKLFEALMRTNGIPENAALKIIESAQRACKDHDSKKLHSEKSSLIKEINYKIGKSTFYNQKIENYRDYATVQTAINMWRKGKVDDFQKLLVIEGKIVKMLTEEVQEETLSEHKNSQINNLTVKIMLEKFNSKYSSVLNKEQQDIIKEYIFSNSKNEKALIESAKKIQNKTISDLKRFMLNNSNQTLKSNYEVVLKNIQEFNITEINDDTIGKTLTMSKLCQEILEN